MQEERDSSSCYHSRGDAGCAAFIAEYERYLMASQFIIRTIALLASTYVAFVAACSAPKRLYATEEIPLNATLSPWTEWSPCSVACNAVRQRECYHLPEVCAGFNLKEFKSCQGGDCVGPETTRAPPTVDEWTTWSDWSSCSTTCGAGTKTRTRKCSSGQREVALCAGNATEWMPCAETPCPAPEWGPWGPWQQCSMTCIPQGSNEKSVQLRVRDCLNANPQAGRICIPQNEGVESKPCDVPQCPTPIDGGWTAWSPWTSCSLTCAHYKNLGTVYRSRACSNPKPLFGGKDCPGQRTELDGCDTSQQPKCPADGGWSAWTPVTPCRPDTETNECSEGWQNAERQCNNPEPVYPGAPCDGAPNRLQRCWTLDRCPQELQPPQNFTARANNLNIELTWTRTPYGRQAKAFRPGYMEDTPGLEKNKLLLPDIPVSPEQANYNVTIRELKPHVHYLVWVATVSATDGTIASAIPQTVVTGKVDGNWAEWGLWGACSSNCFKTKGTKDRTRTCTNPPPSSDGLRCPGESIKSDRCFGTDNC